MKRHAPIRQFGPGRNARTARLFGLQSRLCERLCCCSCGAPPPSDPDHVRTRGARGEDRANCAPLCRPCHEKKERGAITFDEQHAPFYVCDPESGEGRSGPYTTLKDVAKAIEQLAYPTQECGCSWDWVDENDAGDLVCFQPQCVLGRHQ